MIPSQDEEKNDDIDDDEDMEYDDMTCLIRVNPKSMYQRRKKRKQKEKINKKSTFIFVCGFESVCVFML